LKWRCGFSTRKEGKEMSLRVGRGEGEEILAYPSSNTFTDMQISKEIAIPNLHIYQATHYSFWKCQDGACMEYRQDTGIDVPDGQFRYVGHDFGAKNVTYL